ncbi:hypothetical protein RUM43_012986 [Polyplax serrata]|uniref:Uncharacterized protein n=1 Tax=Polyplax serrata TaxID=468196 RepID=A0AAN8PCA3_POLSC
MKLPEILKPLENKEELKTKGLALFAKLIRTKNVEKLQGETVIPGRKTTDDKKQKLQLRWLSPEVNPVVTWGQGPLHQTHPWQRQYNFSTVRAVTAAAAAEGAVAQEKSKLQKIANKHLLL